MLQCGVIFKAILRIKVRLYRDENVPAFMLQRTINKIILSGLGDLF